MSTFSVIAVCVSAVSISTLAYFAFMRWVLARYPKATVYVESDASKRIAALEERLTTIELQRGVTRIVKGT